MIVFTAAIMDLCHRGHINLLETMRACAGTSGKVIVVLHDDRACFRIKHKVPIQSISQRVHNLEVTDLVDEVLVTELMDPSDQFLRIFERYGTGDILFIRGNDNLSPPGKWLLDYMSIPQEYIDYTTGVSSTELAEELRHD